MESEKTEKKTKQVAKRLISSIESDLDKLKFNNILHSLYILVKLNSTYSEKKAKVYIEKISLKLKVQLDKEISLERLRNISEESQDVEIDKLSIDCARILSQNGDEQYKLGNNLNAANFYDLAIGFNDSFHWPWFNRGNAYLNSAEGNPVEYPEKILQTNERISTKMDTNGKVYHPEEYLEKAIESFEHAINILGVTKEGDKDIIKEQSELAWNNLGITYSLKRQYGDAIRCFKQVLEINPNMIDALNNIGSAYLQKKDYPKAIESYKKVLLLEPQHKESKHNMGIAFYEMGGIGHVYAELKSDINEINQKLSEVLEKKNK